MPVRSDGADILLVTEKALWPLDQGFRIRGYHMSRALSERGNRVVIASMQPLPADAPDSLRAITVDWPAPSADQTRRFNRGWSGPLAPLRRRLAKHQLVAPERLAGVVSLVERYRPQVVVGLGQHSPLMLAGLHNQPDVKTIWYAADELLYFHLSCLRRDALRDVPGRLHNLAISLMLERLFLRLVDGAIGVAPSDTRLLRWIGGARKSVCVPNGVDLDYFNPGVDHDTPTAPPAHPKSVVFWGRMDFEPNIDAACWFAHNVWDRLVRHSPDAQYWIVGKNPTPAVRELAALPGIHVVGEVADIRPYAMRAAATILPMRCGGGIKNKLLEAAAMARPIVASHRSIRGLNLGTGKPPIMVCANPSQWSQAIDRLWSDQTLRARIGQQAAAWVRSHHDWDRAARDLCDWITASRWAQLPDDTRLHPPHRADQINTPNGYRRTISEPAPAIQPPALQTDDSARSAA